MYAQVNCTSIIYRAETESMKPIQNSIITNDENFNAALAGFDILSILQARPDGTTPNVLALYEIKLNDTSQIDSLYNLLKSLTDNDDLIKVCTSSILEAMNNCSSQVYNDPLVQGDEAWYLNGMRIPCAWNITQGSGDLVVAVPDIFFDYSHSDLANKFHSITNVTNFQNVTCGHGFASAGAVAAIVNNNNCTVGSGYNTKVAGYIVGVESSPPCSGGQASSGVWQAYKDGHKIISVSFDNVSITLSEVDEMLASGVTIIQGAAGNSDSNFQRAAKNGYIYVGQADRYFSHVGGAYGDQTGADIYALCIDVPRLQGLNSCSVGTGNTSFGAPTVAGVVALMKHVNPCLTPDEIERIIKESTNIAAYNVPFTNHPYIMDAYEAVLAAQNGMDLIVDQNMTISDTRYISGNVYIKANATLTITGTLKMSKKILVERLGTLRVDGGKITNNCGQLWEGIVIEGASKNQSFSGKVILINNAIIENAVNAISTNATHIPWPALTTYWGGLIQATNSTIRDCRRAVEIMRMRNDNSFFKNCNFTNIVNHAVTIWDNDYIKIEECDFTNVGKSGIYTIDGRYQAKSNNFRDMTRGIDNNQTLPAADIAPQLLDNTFEAVNVGIFSQGGVYSDQIELSSNIFYNIPNGIIINGLSGYSIFSNQFYEVNEAIKFSATGMNQIYSLVQDNVFFNNRIATLANYDNSTSYINNCFRFGTHTDIMVAYGSIAGEQGNEFLGASNCFSRGGSRDIRITNNVPFNYYHKIGEFTCRTALSPEVQGGWIYSKKNASEEINNNCEGHNVPQFLYPTCGIPLSEADRDKMISDLEKEILRLTNDENVNSITRAYLIQKYRACIRRIGQRRLYEIVNDSTSTDRAQSARDGAAFALQTADFENIMYGYSALVENELYADALQYLMAIPDTTEEAADFIDIQLINLDYMQNPLYYQIDTLTENHLYSLGSKNIPVAGFARSLYRKITGEEIPVIFLYAEDEDEEELEDRSYFEVAENINVVSIYPNPADNMIYVQYEASSEEKVWYQISDLRGNVLMTSKLLNDIQLVDINSLASGMYFFKVFNDRGTVKTSKIIKK